MFGAYYDQPNLRPFSDEFQPVYFASLCSSVENVPESMFLFMKLMELPIFRLVNML